MLRPFVEEFVCTAEVLQWNFYTVVTSFGSIFLCSKDSEAKTGCLSSTWQCHSTQFGNTVRP